MSNGETKTEGIDIQTTQATKHALQSAALTARKNVSEFLLDAGMAAAAEMPTERRIFALNASRGRAFQKALDRPIRAKPRLARLLSEPSVLE